MSTQILARHTNEKIILSLKQLSRSALLLLISWLLTHCKDSEQKPVTPTDISADILAVINTLPTEGDITNYLHFPARKISRSSAPFNFPVNTERQSLYLNSTVSDGETSLILRDYLTASATVAFLVIHNDTIKVEEYLATDGNTYNANSVVTSWSVAKSFVSALVGIAIGEGKIQSVEESITSYLPELNNGRGFERITIKHLLQMTSGIKFVEDYQRVDAEVRQLYLTTNIAEYIKTLTIEQAPGEEFEYQSINTQLLGMIVARATKVSLTQYLQEKLWTPLGMESDATWSLDQLGGVEKAYCCINAKARDFAKFGHLYLRNGKWNGQQIVPAAWVAASTAPETEAGAPFYKYQWWLMSGWFEDTLPDYSAIGILGQYVYVNPQKNLVIVKFSNDKQGNFDDPAVFRAIAEQIQ